jgi:NADPH:quinone reductase-like Zn-dependent oxidoreductase
MDLPTPDPRPGNVVVKARASGINRLEHVVVSAEGETNETTQPR